MGFIAKLLGADLDSLKRKKFKEFDEKFDIGFNEGKDQEMTAHDEQMALLMKVSWLTSRGNAYGQRGDLDIAIHDFLEAKSLMLGYVPAHMSLAIAYREKGKFKEALDVLENAPKKLITIGNDENYEFDLLFLATTVHLKMKDKVGVIESGKKALRFAEEHKDEMKKRHERNEELASQGLMPEGSSDNEVEMLKDLISSLEASQS